MKKIKLFTMFLSVSCLSGLVLPAQADDSTANKAANTGDYNNANSLRDREAGRWQHPQLGELKEASHLMGMVIKNAQGEREGKVKDLALDLKNGRIVEVIITTGGVAGMDERLAAIPPSLLNFNEETKSLSLNTSQDVKALPEFHWAEATQNSMVRDVYQRFGARPYFGETARWNSTNENDILGTPTDSAAASNTRAEDSRGQASHYYPNKQESANDHQAGNPEHMRYAQMQPMFHGHIIRASELIGSATKNGQDESLGSVKDLGIDLPAGRVVEVILSTGGFLGAGAELSAVPPQAFACEIEKVNLVLDKTKDDMKLAPHFTAKEWRNANDSRHVTEVYSTYHVRPYFVDTDMDRDSTAQNVRERSQNGLTASDQGNSREDIDTTAQIRKSVMAETNLSQKAKNVKVITLNGQVTLRGVVNSQEEKTAIVDAAARVAGREKVTDQLEVRGANQ